MSVEIKQLPKSEIEITCEISGEDFDHFWDKAVKEISKDAKFPGFRPGNIPEKIVIEKIGESSVLERTGEVAIRDTYPKIAKERNLEIIGYPRASVLKIARHAPFVFKIVVAVLPRLTLPTNFKELAKKEISKKEEIKIEEKEINETLEQLRKMKVGQSKDLPELNDEFAKSVGQFNSLEELKSALKENLKYEKESRQKEKNKLSAMDAILKEMSFEIPEVLVSGEKGSMLHNLKHSVTDMGMRWEDYLSQWKKADLSAEALEKAEKELLDGWSEEALKRVKYGLLLDELSRAIDVKISDEEIGEKIKKVHPHDDSHKCEVDHEKLKDYAYGIIRNEKIFKFLEDL